MWFQKWTKPDGYFYIKIAPKKLMFSFMHYNGQLRIYFLWRKMEIWNHAGIERWNGTFHLSLNENIYIY